MVETAPERLERLLGVEGPRRPRARQDCESADGPNEHKPEAVVEGEDGTRCAYSLSSGSGNQ
jgi:hypothetical protein